MIPPIVAQAMKTAAARSTPNNVPLHGIARWTPSVHKKDENGKYSLTLLIPPEADLTALQTSIDAAVEKTFGRDIRAGLGLKLPLHLATDKGKYPGYEAGWFLVRASTKRALEIVDAIGAPVSPDAASMELYDGRWIEMQVGPYGFNLSGNKGVALGLNGIQLLDAGEQIGRSAANFGVYSAPMEPKIAGKPTTQSAWS